MGFPPLTEGWRRLNEDEDPRLFRRPGLSVSEPREEPPSVNCRCLFLIFFSRPAGGVARSVALAGLAAHLPEVRAAAELELQHQRAVGHFVHVFAFWRQTKKKDTICDLVWPSF